MVGPTTMPARRHMTPLRTPETPGRKSKTNSNELTVEKLTVVVGLCFILVNVVVFYLYMPRHDVHQHHQSRRASEQYRSQAPIGPLPSAARAKAPVRGPQPESTGAIFAPPALIPRHDRVAPPGAAHKPLELGAPATMARFLAACARRPRCACLQHGLGYNSEAVFAAFPSVAFFVIASGAAAQPLASRLIAANMSHVYVLRADLQMQGAGAMANGVLNPQNKQLSALQALRVSNEFFDLQLVHSSAADWLTSPVAADARAVLSLAATTLLLLPSPTAVAAWRDAISSTRPPPSAGSEAASGEAVNGAAADAVDETSRVEAAVSVSGCGGGSTDGADLGCADGSASSTLRDDGTRGALLVHLTSLRRLNAHHYSCWHSPKCHQRMYVMDLPRDGHANEGAPGAAPHSAATWRQRVPRLYRVDDGTRFGPHKFATLAEAWELRGKDLGFDTGGMNLDTAIGLQLTAGARARLAAQFLALPVGRDMMLWNIIVGREGLYAIDQEGHAFDDGAIPWGQRVWPYCISVRDCYEKALAALCGRRRPTQLLTDCFAALTRAELCPDASQPYPCPNGCQPSFLDCRRRRPKSAVFVARKPVA